MLGIVLIVKPAAGIDRHIANLVISRGNAEHLPAGAAKFTDRANVVALDHRRDGADELGVITDRGVVVPNIVKKERSLCAQRVDNDCFTMSRKARIVDHGRELFTGLYSPVGLSSGLVPPDFHLLLITMPDRGRFPHSF